MAEKNVEQHLQKEIGELEMLLEAKKRELKTASPEHEREIFREIFRERFDELHKAIQEAVPRAGGEVSAPLYKESVRDLKKEEKIQELIAAAFERGPREAIRRAHALGDFWVDELHDRLSDEYYEKLLEFRRIQKL